MSVESLAAVLHHSRAKGTAKLVAVGIANHDGDGGAWPTIATLARYANVTPRNVQAALAKLTSLGELVVELQAGGTPQLEDHERPNLYRLLVSCPPWCDRTPHHRDTRASRQSHLRGVGSDTPPVSRLTPRPVSAATPKPPTQPDPSVVGTEAQPARAVRWCSGCNRTETAHELAEAKLPPEDRHELVVRDAAG